MSEVFKALLKFQKDPPNVEKDSTNPFFNNSPYASLDSIMGAVRPALNKVGLVVTQHPYMEEDGRVGVTTMITHAETGEQITAPAMCVVQNGDAQKVGAAITYLKRYGLASILGLSTEPDDDGNATVTRQNATEKYHREVGEPGTVAPSATASAPATDRTQADRAVENRIKIGRMLMEMNNDDAGDAADHLEVLTEWEKDGKEFPGKRSTRDISDKATYPVLLRTEEAYAAWKESDAADDSSNYADEPVPATTNKDEIPF